jgi:tetratricopeptide (TPR) repeat protein
VARFILVFLIFFSLGQKAIASYEVNENCRTAWMLLMDLKIGKAKALLREETRINPDNYYAYYLDQTCDAYKMIINSDEEDYEAFVDNFYKKRELMDGKDIDSPYYLACYSEMEIQLGMFNIIHGAQYRGVRKMYAGYRKVYRNLDKFPGFKPSLKLDGFFNVAMSTMPPFVKWVVSFFGISTNIDYGFKLLNENYQSQKNAKGINAESALFIILVAKINKTPEMVYDFTRSLDSSISQTFIHQYFKANIAYRIGKNEEALTTLQQIHPNTSPSAQIAYNYLMGKIRLQKLDDSAAYYLSEYISHLKKNEYVKEINYKLAQYYLINNKPSKYLEYCEIARENGSDMNERDREALYDASLDYFPDVNLVKARLLLEGGYLEKFNLAIKDYESNARDLLPYVLEYSFLKARYDALQLNNIDAKAGFKKVIALGDDEDYYFASEAALRLGNIYLQEGDVDLAKVYYEKSLKLYKSNYYEYIEDKAVKALRNL